MIRIDEDGDLLDPPDNGCGSDSPMCGCSDCVRYKAAEMTRRGVRGWGSIKANHGPFSSAEIWYAQHAHLGACIETLHRNGLTFIVQRGPEAPPAVEFIERLRIEARVPGLSRPELTLAESMETIEVQFATPEAEEDDDAALMDDAVGVPSGSGIWVDQEYAGS